MAELKGGDEMPSVEELLNSATPVNIENPESEIAVNKISYLDEGAPIDTIDSYLEIDPNTREIKIPEEEKVLGVTSDENGERKYFRIDRYAGNNLDFSKAHIYINYRDANENLNQYLCTDVTAVDENTVTFSWLLSRSALRYKGTIYFIVCCKWSDTDGNILNEWNTTLASGECLEGLEATGTTAIKYADIIEQLLNLFQTNVESDMSYDSTTRVIKLKKNDDVGTESLLPALTADADATAADIYTGRTAYVDGEKITGTFNSTGDVVASGISAQFETRKVTVPMVGTVDTPYIVVDAKVAAKDNRFVMTKDSKKDIEILLGGVNFGDAKATDVAEGKTFTSQSGMKIVGVSSAINTADGNIQPADVRSGKKAYSKGSLVRGTLSVNDELSYHGNQNLSNVTENSKKYVKLVQQIRPNNSTSETIISGNSQTVTVNIDAEKFGDATAADVAKGKTFTSAAGLKQTGTSTGTGGGTVTVDDTTESGQTKNIVLSNPTKENSNLVATKTQTADMLLKSGSTLKAGIPLSNLGDATASSVAKGKTFTSSAGVKVTGTYEAPASGTDTSDATASASDILADKTAYIASGKVTGTLATIAQVTNAIGKYNSTPATVSWRASGGSGLNVYDDAVKLEWSTGETYSGYLGNNTPVIALAKPEDFGNATADKVLSSYTFTSAAGVKVKGTVTKASLTNDADATAADILNGKTAYVKGVKLTGTHVCETGIDTSDATATKDDILHGATAYVKGSKVTGTVIEVASGSTDGIWDASTTKAQSGNLVLESSRGTAKLVRSGSKISMQTPLTNLGNATAADVAKGKTFTSSAGLKVTGTLEQSTGVDTSDATATATDIAEDKTVYVKGTKVTGTLTTISSTGTKAFDSTSVSPYADDISIKAKVTADTIFRTDATIQIYVPRTDFGDATASDVAKGKTFTSTAGLKVVGTYEAPSGSGDIKNGVITTTGTSATIDTGLTSISRFMMHMKGSHNSSSTGFEAIYYDGSAWHGIGINKSSYLTSPLTSTPSASISGGTVTISNNLYSSEEYEWFAM